LLSHFILFLLKFIPNSVDFFLMIISGKDIALQIEEQIKEIVSNLAVKPCLAVVLVGSHSPSQTYVKAKQKACERVGIESLLFAFPETISEKELLFQIGKFNENPLIHGILIQLPLPSHINPYKMIESVDPHKDVDGFHPINMGRLLLGLESAIVPCTPLGIKVLLEHVKIPLSGKHVVILGRSHTVGKPLAVLLMQNQPELNATVTVVHRMTEHIINHLKHADIVVAAIGSPRFLTAEMVKEGAVVIDVGINREEDSSLVKGYRIVGDADFESLKNKVSAITPVPNGVGPMTVAMLLQNTLRAFLKRTN
jgi:methylenetetrahydrofolate dehydrogenase (NADP+)/methenyltetrahydrofolate cyclohydrolase